MRRTICLLSHISLLVSFARSVEGQASCSRYQWSRLDTLRTANGHLAYVEAIDATRLGEELLIAGMPAFTFPAEARLHQQAGVVVSSGLRLRLTSVGRPVDVQDLGMPPGVATMDQPRFFTSPEGKTLMLFRKRPLGKDSVPDDTIWQSEWSGGAWTRPAVAIPANDLSRWRWPWVSTGAQASEESVVAMIGMSSETSILRPGRVHPEVQRTKLGNQRSPAIGRFGRAGPLILATLGMGREVDTISTRRLDASTGVWSAAQTIAHVPKDRLTTLTWLGLSEQRAIIAWAFQGPDDETKLVRAAWTTDGGRTWLPSSTWTPRPGTYHVAFDADDSGSLHVYASIPGSPGLEHAEGSVSGWRRLEVLESGVAVNQPYAIRIGRGRTLLLWGVQYAANGLNAAVTLTQVRSRACP